MCTHVSNIVTKANQSDAVSLFRSSFETEEILTEVDFSPALMVYHRKIITFIKKEMLWQTGHLSKTPFSYKA